MSSSSSDYSPWKSLWSRTQRKEKKPRRKKREQHITFVDTAARTKTELNYTHTRCIATRTAPQRHPWICSLSERRGSEQSTCHLDLTPATAHDHCGACPVRTAPIFAKTRIPGMQDYLLAAAHLGILVAETTS